MTLDPKAIANLTVNFSVRRWLRISPIEHIATPLSVAHGASRFSSSGKLFKTLYMAKTVRTATAEALIRDRFLAKSASERLIEFSEIEALAIAEISTSAALRVVDLRKAGALRLGLDTDAVGARDHRLGQTFAEELYREFPDIDGLLYSSRLTEGDCLAVFEPAIAAKLTAGQAVPLHQLKQIVSILSGLFITLVK